MVPASAFFGSVAPISHGFQHSAFAFSTCTITRPDHEADQIVEEQALFVHRRVKAFGFGAGQVLHLGGNHFQASSFKAAVDLADDIF